MAEMDARDELEGCVLSDEELEAVVGGISGIEKMKVEIEMRNLYRQGLTMDQAVAKVKTYTNADGSPSFTSDMIKYLMSHWGAVRRE